MSIPLPTRFSFSPLALLFLASAILAGCGSTPTSEFFVLTPRLGAEDQLAVPLFKVGLQPIVLPAEVNRAQMIFNVAPHQRHVAEFTRWASPLADNITRVIEQNLEGSLGRSSVYRHPARLSPPLDYLLLIEILQFDSKIDGPCELRARFHLAGPTGKWITSETFRSSSEGQSGGPAGVAEAMSKNLGQLSDAIAARARASHGS